MQGDIWLYHSKNGIRNADGKNNDAAIFKQAFIKKGKLFFKMVGQK